MPEASTFKSDLLRGFRGHCPQCGEGKMFRAFLKVADRCEACGEELHHHHADDLPAYLVVVVVGHLVVATLLAVEAMQIFGYWAEIAFFVPLTIVLSLLLLQPMKGAVVALQWHMGMDGFAEAKRGRNFVSAR